MGRAPEEVTLRTGALYGEQDAKDCILQDSKQSEVKSSFAEEYSQSQTKKRTVDIYNLLGPGNSGPLCGSPSVEIGLGQAVGPTFSVLPGMARGPA